MNKITLEQLQKNAGRNGLVLDTNDLGVANKMVAAGNTRKHIFDCARCWADEYARVAVCEAREANSNEYIYA
jgi:hypothetical protein